MIWPYFLTYYLTYNDPVALYISDTDNLVLYLVNLLQQGQIDCFFDAIRLNINVIRNFSQYQDMFVFNEMALVASKDSVIFDHFVSFGFPIVNPEILTFPFICFSSKVYDVWLLRWIFTTFIVVPFGHHAVIYGLVFFNDCLMRYLANRDLHMPPKSFDEQMGFEFASDYNPTNNATEEPIISDIPVHDNDNFNEFTDTESMSDSDSDEYENYGDFFDDES